MRKEKVCVADGTCLLWNPSLPSGRSFLAYQTWFSAIFTSADKFFLAYPTRFSTGKRNTLTLFNQALYLTWWWMSSRWECDSRAIGTRFTLCRIAEHQPECELQLFWHIHLTKVITVHPIFWQLVLKIKTRNQWFLFYTAKTSSSNFT